MECEIRREATPPAMGATIIDLAVVRRRHTMAKASPAPAARMEFGGGYHDAAIKAEQARPHDA